MINAVFVPVTQNETSQVRRRKTSVRRRAIWRRLYASVTALGQSMKNPLARTGGKDGKMSNKLVEQVKLSPERYFRSPSDIIFDDRFDDAERLEILLAWEADARALSVATDESMIGSEPNRLQDVVNARLEIEG